MDNTELVRVFEMIDLEKLSESDFADLIVIFNNIENDRIRNHISFIFSDLKYVNSVPHLLKKIFDPKMYDKNGSLVYALIELVAPKDINKVIEILITQNYECRRSALEMIIELAPKLKSNQKNKALVKLNLAIQIELNKKGINNEYSTLEYIKETIKVINDPFGYKIDFNDQL